MINGIVEILSTFTLPNAGFFTVGSPVQNGHGAMEHLILNLPGNFYTAEVINILLGVSVLVLGMRLCFQSASKPKSLLILAGSQIAAVFSMWISDYFLHAAPDEIEYLAAFLIFWLLMIGQKRAMEKWTLRPAARTKPEIQPAHATRNTGSADHPERDRLGEKPDSVFEEGMVQNQKGKDVRLWWQIGLGAAAGSVLVFLCGWYFGIRLWLAIAIAAGAAVAGGYYQWRTSRKHYRYPTYPKLVGLQESLTRQSRQFRRIYQISAFFALLYLFWRILFTIPFGQGPGALAGALILLLAELLNQIDFVLNIQSMSKVRNYPLPEIDPDQIWPDVDVFIATYNESRNLLYKTVNGCLKMRYPDPKKVHIYLCDDGNRPEIASLAKEKGIHYLARQDRMGAKAGNLNHALNHSSSPYIVTLDADMIPKSEFLLQTIPYFIQANALNAALPADQQAPLGFIQTPQSFYNPDLFQYHLYGLNEISNEQDYFYRIIEPAKTATNSVIYGGSNTVLSRQALQSVGGFYTKAITEDFATGLLIEGNGYVSLGLSQPLASGLSPDNFAELIKQRIRWGRGVINVLYQVNLFFTRRYSGEQKKSYWAAISYWFNPIIRAIYYIMPILSALLGLSVISGSPWTILLFWSGMILSNVWALRSMSHQKRSPLMTNVYDTILFPFLIGPIFLEMIGISLKTFKVTNKSDTIQRHFHLRYFIPFLLLTILTILAIIVGFYRIFILQIHGLLMTEFWLFYNLGLLTAALVFVLGRREKEEYLHPCIVYVQANDSSLKKEDSAQIQPAPAFTNVNKTESALEIESPGKTKQQIIQATTVKTEQILPANAANTEPGISAKAANNEVKSSAQTEAKPMHTVRENEKSSNPENNAKQARTHPENGLEGVAVGLNEEMIDIIFVKKPEFTVGQNVELELEDEDNQVVLEAQFTGSYIRKDLQICRFHTGAASARNYDQFLALIYSRSDYEPDSLPIKGNFVLNSLVRHVQDVFGHNPGH